MIERFPFTTEDVEEIKQLIEEGVRKIEANFEDETYPRGPD